MPTSEFQNSLVSPSILMRFSGKSQFFIQAFELFDGFGFRFTFIGVPMVFLNGSYGENARIRQTIHFRSVK